MHNHDPHNEQSAQQVPPASAAAWQAILQRVADDIDLVVEDFLAELRGSSLYEDGLVEHADLRHTAHETFRYLLDQMMHKPMSAHQQDAAKRLGRRRADQKVQLEDLMAAIRLDFIVLWRRMRAVIRQTEQSVLVDHTEELLTNIEQYIGQVQLEFLAETARFARDARLATERHLSRLLNATTLSPSVIEHIAQGLHVSATGRFEIVVVHESAVLEVQEQLSELLATGQVLGHPFGSSYCLIQSAEPLTTPLSELCAGYAGGYLPTVEGLAQVPAAAASLYALLNHHTELPGLHSISELWPRAVALMLTDVLTDFPDRYAIGLQELAVTDFTDVVETVHSYLATGSVKETAEAIGRHRNTVINRLRTFEAATGLDVKIPRQAVLATLVLATDAGQMHK